MAGKVRVGAEAATIVALALMTAACGGGVVASASGQPAAATATVGTSSSAPTATLTLPLPTAPGSGARMISPVPGSTLPTGAVTFTWDDAHGDYFLTIESVAGAHDIVYAIVHVTSITIGPDCAPAPPILCIPPHGEKIFVRLMTQIKGVWNAGFDYTYTAAGA